MTTLCLIGNSHIAALKLGLPQIQPLFPGFALDFYACAGEALELKISGGKLVAATDHIRSRLAVTSGKSGDIEPIYDAYVLCGLTLSAMRAIRAYNIKLMELRSIGQAKTATVADFAQAMEPALRLSLAVDIAAKLRELTQAPIFLIATPFAAYERHADLWQKLATRRLEAHVAQAYEMACNTVAQDLSATFVPQPAETVGGNGLTTREEFYLLPLEQVRMEKAPHTHMNPAYGAIVLRDVLERIRARLAQS